VNASADNYIYKTSTVFGGIAAQSTIFQTRSDSTGGGWAWVAGSTPSVVASISSAGALTATTGTFSNSGGVTARGLNLTDGDTIQWTSSSSRVFFNGGAFRVDVNGTQYLGISTAGLVTMPGTLGVTGSIAAKAGIVVGVSGTANAPQVIEYAGNTTTVSGGLGTINWYNYQWDSAVKASIAATTDTALSNGRLTLTANTVAVSGAATFSSDISGTSGSTRLKNISADATSTVVATFDDSSGGSTTHTLISIQRAEVQVGSISVSNTATGYNTSSDVRLKTNIRDIVNSGAIVDALQPRVFDWKIGDAPDTYGFIAQEVIGVYPQAVAVGDDDDDVISTRWGLDASKLMPIAIAEIKALRARVAALEAV
jgi:hypothetical protein